MTGLYVPPPARQKRLPLSKRQLAAVFLAGIVLTCLGLVLVQELAAVKQGVGL